MTPEQIAQEQAAMAQRVAQEHADRMAAMTAQQAAQARLAAERFKAVANRFNPFMKK